MALTELRIKNLRNISNMEIQPNKGTNILHGSNGSGKTSILESIYLLARGRSFRGSRNSTIINTDSEEMTVFGAITDLNSTHRIGITKTKSETKIRVDGQNLQKLSHLAQITPLQIITPQSYHILEQGPESRRKYVDWGVFHVEHDYSELCKRYNRALFQRNTALKSSPNQAWLWDKELSTAGEILNEKRQQYVDTLKSALKRETDIFLDGLNIAINWKTGWQNNKSLYEQLTTSRERDAHRGYTGNGPHRADLDIRIDKDPIVQIASRGQQKLFIVALVVAQLKILDKMGSSTSIVLLDDVAAELDQKNREKVIMRFKKFNVQMFITSTEIEPLADFADQMFHVEHGSIK